MSRKSLGYQFVTCVFIDECNGNAGALREKRVVYSDKHGDEYIRRKGKLRKLNGRVYTIKSDANDKTRY